MMCGCGSRLAFFLLSGMLAAVFHGAFAQSKGKPPLPAPEQHINGTVTARGAWELSVDVRDPRIQCSNEPITATFEIISDYLIVETPVSTDYLPHEKRVLLYPSQDIVDVTLMPWNTTQHECNALPNATLPIRVNCRDCKYLQSIVRFSYGKALGDFTPTMQARLPPMLVGDYRLIGIISIVPNDLLESRRGANVTAVFEFRYPVDASKKYFHVRPRGLLERDGALYVEPLNGEGHRVVASVQLPETWPEDYKPRLMLDVSCYHCIVWKGLSIRYQPSRPKWRAVKSAAVFSRLNRDQVARRLIDYQPAVNSRNERKRFSINVSRQCSKLLEAGLLIDASPLLSEPEFFVVNHQRARFNTTVVQNGVTRLVRWLPEDTEEICRSSVVDFVAKNPANFSVTHAVEYSPYEPEVPPSVRVVDEVKFSTVWQAPKASCHIAFNITAATMISSWKLWFRNENENITKPPTVSEVGVQRAQLRQWQAQLTRQNLTKTYKNMEEPFKVQLSGGTRALCQQLQFRAYGVIDTNFGDDTKEPRRVETAPKPLPFSLTPHVYQPEPWQSPLKLLFKNFLSLEQLRSSVPFVATICFNPIADNSRIESIFFENQTPMTEFNTKDYNRRCFAFDSCDVWQAVSQNRGNASYVPPIFVTGVNPPEIFYWRVDVAVRPPQNLTAGSTLIPNRGGWYATAAQRSLYTSLGPFREVKIETTPTLRCVPVSPSGDFNSLRGNKKVDQDSTVYVRPTFQLQPVTTLLYDPEGHSAIERGIETESDDMNSGDWRNAHTNSFISLFVLAAIAFYL